MSEKGTVQYVTMDDKTIKEVIRGELKKLSGMTWKQRLGYVWDYYKPLMVAILVIIACISLGVEIYHNLQINHIFQAYMVNANTYELDTESMIAEFAEYLGGIGADDEITIDATITYDEDDNTEYGMASQMKLVTYGAAGEMDILIGDDALFDHYIQSDGLLDLREVLTEEELELWEDDLIWGTDSEGTEGIYAIKLTDAPVLTRYNAYPQGDSYGMIPLSSKHLDLVPVFLEYLMGQ